MLRKAKSPEVARFLLGGSSEGIESEIRKEILGLIDKLNSSAKQLRHEAELTNALTKKLASKSVVSDFPEEYAKELATGMVRDFAESFPADPEAFDTFHISEDDLYRGIFSALTWVDMDRLNPWINCKDQMPKDGEDVAYRDQEGVLYSFNNCDEGDRLKMLEYGATVWMPIPPTPEGKQ